jgi:hypothetical protein
MSKRKLANKVELLNSLYYGDGPGSYSGVDGLYEAAKRLDPTIKRQEISQYLDTKSGYQKTKQQQTRHLVPKYKSKRFHQVSGPGFISADTMFLNRLPGPYNYAQVDVDMFTKKIALKFMRTLTSKSAAAALEKAIKDEFSTFPVQQVYTDDG